MKSELEFNNTIVSILFQTTDGKVTFCNMLRHQVYNDKINKEKKNLRTFNGDG